jgi:hypothetical protein
MSVYTKGYFFTHGIDEIYTAEEIKPNNHLHLSWNII